MRLETAKRKENSFSFKSVQVSSGRSWKVFCGDVNFLFSFGLSASTVKEVNNKHSIGRESERVTKMDQELKLDLPPPTSWLVISNSTIILSSILLLLISLMTYHRIKQWRIAASKHRKLPALLSGITFVIMIELRKNRGFLFLICLVSFSNPVIRSSQPDSPSHHWAHAPHEGIR